MDCGMRAKIRFDWRFGPVKHRAFLESLLNRKFTRSIMMSMYRSNRFSSNIEIDFKSHTAQTLLQFLDVGKFLDEGKFNGKMF